MRGPGQDRKSLVGERLLRVRLGFRNASERWGLSSDGQHARCQDKWQHCVQRSKRGHVGPRGSLEKRGVNVGIQEDQVGRDMLNITRSLRAQPRDGMGGGGDRSMYSWEKEEGGGSLHASHDGLARAASIQPGLSSWDPPALVSSSLKAHLQGWVCRGSCGVLSSDLTTRGEAFESGCRRGVLVGGWREARRFSLFSVNPKEDTDS